MLFSGLLCYFFAGVHASPVFLAFCCDLTLVCEYSNSKLVDEIAVADIDAEKHVDGLVDILKLNFIKICVRTCDCDMT